MSEHLKDLAVEEFFKFYREELDYEVLDDTNVVISFPVHFSGFHRVEVTVTRVNENQFLVSDGAKTLEELKNAGYDLNTKLRKRVETISRSARIRCGEWISCCRQRQSQSWQLHSKVCRGC